MPRVTILSCGYPQDLSTRISNPFPVNKDIFLWQFQEWHKS
ncbi:conserved hypothetical protein [Klebsiella variicola]|uniref:Uncharacterized protein n=1 Tax=Klebsiella variicola (strain 342) TaxID=507522 RepID=B5XPY2_KLEV3|nr:hypothetical protein KPK_1886 [Klebsiella variicola]CTQ14767.1 conserved hypothetical protein [Klebsiella variicola]CTQ15801.1 conserved hypothetical protein [Klebsiella variicola]